MYETPQFAKTALRVIGTGWKISGILRLQSGGYLTVVPGTDRALTATGVAAAFSDVFGMAET